MSKTSVTIADQSKKKLEEVARQTGLSQSQVLDVLLGELQAIRIVCEWKQHQPLRPEESKDKKRH